MEWARRAAAAPNSLEVRAPCATLSPGFLRNRIDSTLSKCPTKILQSQFPHRNLRQRDCVASIRANFSHAL